MKRFGGRLFRKYFVLIFALVCGALVMSGGTGLYFSYQESKASLAALQEEKALTAATHIEQFVQRIGQQLAYAAPQIGVEALEQRRVELLKLQRFAKDVTDVAEIGSNGRERLFESRVAMSVMASGKDRSQEPAFRNARPGEPWFGPVYFRKETEPYITIALRSGGEKGAVIVADVNLKFMWDVVTRIKVGQKGKAYVVDRNGYLIADPDIGLVLRKTDLSGLAQVKAALLGEAAERAMLASDLNGKSVLTAWAPVEPLGWRVFVEQPASEVFQSLYASIARNVALLVAGLVFSALAGLWLARSMARPIGVLQEGAQRIGAGELDHPIEVRTGDELEALAAQFNQMTAQLRESYAGLERKVEDRTAELRQSLAQQTAISEILGVISQSTTDVQPVFEAIARSSLHLLNGWSVVIWRLVGAELRAVAMAGGPAASEQAVRELIGRVALEEDNFLVATVREKRPTQIRDVEADDVPERIRETARIRGWRSNVAVPMLLGERPIGAITLSRTEPGGFSERETQILKTFADQAVIAIENVRLFNETKEALEQQTATSEILQVTSSSPTNIQPVFDAILANAIRLCEGNVAVLWQYDGQKLRFAAHKNASTGAVKLWTDNPLELGDWNPTPQAGLERRTVHVLDVFADPKYRALVPMSSLGVRPNAGTVLAVPLLRYGDLLGVITIWRFEKRLFSDKQVAMMNTFAAQAVIAIENVRLFNETKEALEHQKAISEVLQVISSSPGDVQPVLQAVAERASRLCNARFAGVHLVEGDVLRSRAAWERDRGAIEVPEIPVKRTFIVGRAVIDRRTMHVADMRAAVETEFPDARDNQRRIGFRTFASVPMLREGGAVGAISLWRNEVQPFRPEEIKLLETFAAQAVIAIENVRLFNETKEALEHQTATSDILSVISSSPTDTAPVFQAIVRSGLRLFSGASVTVLLRIGDQIHLGAVTHIDAERARRSRELYPVPLTRDYLTGKAILDGKLSDIPDVESHGGALSPASALLIRKLGYRALSVAPMVAGGTGIGAIAIGRDRPGALSDKQLALLRTFADQAVIAIRNAELFREIQEKSRQLEVANKHKSDFLANMSHELRTPLNAIIGFSEVLIDRMFGEVNEKQLEYLKDIHESGRHLLSLINDILDLSKIEAGRMELELSSFHLPTALSNAMTLVRERAQRHGIQLGQEIDSRLGEFQGDERKVKQILLNLLSNAVKFTPDGGRVDVLARLDTTTVEIAVRDTGIGIAPEDQQAVFEEFKQVGRDYTRKAEGTGLGLALTKKFVELHGGEIRLESAPGKGSTFTFTLPVRQ